MHSRCSFLNDISIPQRKLTAPDRPPTAADEEEEMRREMQALQKKLNVLAQDVERDEGENEMASEGSGSNRESEDGELVAPLSVEEAMARMSGVMCSSFPPCSR